MRWTVVTLTAVLLVLQVSHPLQHTACLHRTVCYSGRPTPNYSWHPLETRSVVRKVSAAIEWGRRIYTVWCIDAQHARKQVGLVTVTHWPAAATWDAGHHSKLNKLLARLWTTVVLHCSEYHDYKYRHWRNTGTENRSWNKRCDKRSIVYIPRGMVIDSVH